MATAKILLKTAKFWPGVETVDETGKEVKEIVREAVEALPSLESGVKYHLNFVQKNKINVGEYDVMDLVDGPRNCFLAAFKDRITRLVACTEFLKAHKYYETNLIHLTFILDLTSGANVVKVISAIPIRPDFEDGDVDEDNNPKSFRIIKFWEDPDKYLNNYQAQKNAYLRRGKVLALNEDERRQILKKPFNGLVDYDDEGNEIRLTFDIPKEDRQYWPKEEEAV